MKMRKGINILCNWVSKHWIFVAVVITAAPWWFSLVLTYWGEDIGFIIVKGAKRHLSSSGIVITLILLFLIITVTLINKYRETHDEDKINSIKHKYWNELLNTVLQSIDKVCEQKYETQLQKIKQIKESDMEPPVIYSNPCNQLKNAISELKTCISYMLSEEKREFELSDLYISIAYNFPLEDENVWKWSDVTDEKGLSIEKLLSKNTTFSYALNNTDEQNPLIFFNSKQEAYENHHYVSDNCDIRDNNKKLQGSICCYKIIIKKYDKEYIRAILSISSYHKQFVDVSRFKTKEQQNEEINNVSYNIEKICIEEFAKRIKIELCNYYIQYLGKNR